MTFSAVRVGNELCSLDALPAFIGVYLGTMIRIVGLLGWGIVGLERGVLLWRTGRSKALGGSGMVPDVTVPVLAQEETSVATRVKILRDFFRVRVACGLASWGGDSLLLEESGGGQKSCFCFFFLAS